MLNFAQDKGVVRIQADEEKGSACLPGRRVPSARDSRAPVAPVMLLREEEEEPQPVVRGQPTAREPRVKRTARKTVARPPSLATDMPDVEAEPDGNAAEATAPETIPSEEPSADQAPPKKATRKMPTKRAGTRRIGKTAAAAAPEPPAEPAAEPDPAPEPSTEQ